MMHPLPAKCSNSDANAHSLGSPLHLSYSSPRRLESTAPPLERIMCFRVASVSLASKGMGVVGHVQQR